MMSNVDKVVEIIKKHSAGESAAPPGIYYVHPETVAQQIDALYGGWISVEDVRFLLSFCPDENVVPTGLDSTFYHTLSAGGDQKIADRLNIIRAKLPEPQEGK